MSTLVRADFVTDCVGLCRANHTEFDGIDTNFNCMCGDNCTEFITLDMCQNKCVDAVNTTYTYILNRETLCDTSVCECVCPERKFQNVDGCKKHCLDTKRQYLGFEVNYQATSDCYFENCTCGKQCPFSPSSVEFCPPIKNKRARYITYSFDKFGCPDNKCTYVDCDDHTVEDFCWMTCPPFTYPQGCFVETDECTECVCAKLPPVFNSCDAFPDKFPVNFNTENCQKHCDATYGNTMRQGVPVLDGVNNKCECVSLTDKYCNSVCIANEGRHGRAIDVNRQCSCSNLPTRPAQLRKRCREVCQYDNKKWTGDVTNRLCVCV
jgi:hypothetical protein